ncbi:MAG: alpha/beta fold hydrolase [Candidatus Saccharibacteria bacterium]
MTTSSVRSKDGTVISYKTIGKGPALIVIPGALAMAEDFTGLATELAKSLTVHIVERRGRGESGPQGDDYSIVKECEDIYALQAKTGAQYLFGHSFGGFVALEAARNNKNVTKLVVYEPGVSINGAISVDWTGECQRAFDQQRYLDAFISFVRGINPDTTGKAPKWLLKLILPLAIKKADREQKYKLLPATIREHTEEVRLNDTYSHYSEISSDVLLLSGKLSGVTAHAADKLATILPNVIFKRFSKMDHFGPEKHPKEIAMTITQFLG